MSTAAHATTPPETVQDGEARRLAALHAHALLDTAPEPEFDAIVRLAAQLFGMPMACIGLLDADRIWMKAGVGTHQSEIDRRVSLGAWAIAQCEQTGQSTVVIEDLRLDPRFDDSPLLRRAKPVRFYAGAPIRDDNGLALGTVGVLDTQVRSFNAAQRRMLQDLASLTWTAMLSRQRGRQLQQLAQTDPLTGAAGALQFEQALDVELRHSMRNGEDFAVLRLDLDGFADINTAYGQAAGDEVLREVGRRLRQQVRLGDLLARLGADDFGIVMRHGGDAEARMLAARIVTAVRQPIDLGQDGQQVSPGISIGHATYSDQIASVAELLARADASLQQARAQKESRWMVFGKLFEGGPDLRLVGNGD